ncbi:hypothetical protein AB4340_03875 [Vibrio breoganii]
MAMNMRNIIIAISLLILSSYSSACALHLVKAEGPEGATWNTIKSQIAMQNGVIEPIQKLGENASHLRSMWWIQLLSRHLDNENLPSLNIYITDVGLWATLDSSTRKVTFDAPVNDSDSYMLITTIVINSILSGTLSFEEAIDLGLIQAFPPSI